ncbi:MAG: magnesium transporter [Candidatus Binatia bacterium]|nr:MAG: magnesium transporter [Candidatus Binatia bacterium]
MGRPLKWLEAFPLGIAHMRTPALPTWRARYGSGICPMSNGLCYTGPMEQDLVYLAVHAGSAWIAGSLIGLERTFHGRPAGFRTHALVCLSSALLMLVTTHQWKWFVGVPLETVRTDPTRMAAGIMTGIGFLGAGVIFKERLTVRGLTTAASIWITAVLGILYGVGLFLPAGLGTLAVLGTLALFRWLEDRIPTQLYARCAVRFARERAPSEQALRAMVLEHKAEVASLSYHLVDHGRAFEYAMVLRSLRRGSFERIAEEWRKEASVLEFHISPTGE